MPTYVQNRSNGQESDEILFVVTVEDLIASWDQSAQDPEDEASNAKPWAELTDPEKEAVIKTAHKAFEADRVTQDWIDETLKQAIAQAPRR